VLLLLGTSFLTIIPIPLARAQPGTTYSSNTTLTADVFCTDVTIDSGTTVTTDGFNFYCTGTFTNDGTINTGYIGNQGSGAPEVPASGATPGGSMPSSYGGSGGGGGGSAAFLGIGPAQVSGSGGSTQSGGGASGTNVGGSCGTGGKGGSGSTPGAPSLTSAGIQSWYAAGMSKYLAGAGGGGGAGSGYDCSYNGGSNGGSGAFGIYIQADDVVAGTINAFGEAGGSVGSGGGGGGGGGVILLAYSDGQYTAGTYDVSGGSGGSANTNGGPGGNGGSGQVLTFDFGSSTPVTSSATTTTISLSNFKMTGGFLDLNDPFSGFSAARDYAISVADFGSIPSTAERDFGEAPFTIDVTNTGSVAAQGVTVEVTFDYTLTYSVCLELNVCTVQETYTTYDVQPTYVGTVNAGQTETVSGQFAINYASVYALVVYAVVGYSNIAMISLPSVGADATQEYASAMGTNTNSAPQVQASTSVGGLNTYQVSINTALDAISSSGLVTSTASKLNDFVTPYATSLGYDFVDLIKAGEIIDGVTTDYKSFTDLASSAISVLYQTIWPGSTVELQAISPTGQVYNATSSSGIVQIFIQNPTPGNWEVKVIGVSIDPGGENYTVSALILNQQSQSNPTGVPEFPFGLAFLMMVTVPALVYVRWKRKSNLD
jgi:hypothetical protein